MGEGFKVKLIQVFGAEYRSKITQMPQTVLKLYLSQMYAQAQKFGIFMEKGFIKRP